eukprot:45828-Pleurochrysis_carterae.AAC.1
MDRDSGRSAYRCSSSTRRWRTASSSCSASWSKWSGSRTSTRPTSSGARLRPRLGSRLGARAD